MKMQLGIARNFPAILAVVMLLLANSSHIHLRYCLDGDEVPVSIHFESRDSHPSELAAVDSLDELEQVDIESELSLDTLLGKFSETVADSVAIFTFYLPPISKDLQRTYEFIGREMLPDSPTSLFPPSRAPPAIA